MNSYYIRPFVGKNFYPIEVPLLNFGQGGENFFKDLASNSILNPNANQKHKVVIRGIEVYQDTQYAVSPSGRPIIPVANSSALVCTFRVGNDEPIYQKPYNDFVKSINYGIVVEIEPTKINLQKSSIVVQSTLPNNTFSAMVGFWYDTLDEKEYDQLMKTVQYRRLNVI